MLGDFDFVPFRGPGGDVDSLALLGRLVYIHSRSMLRRRLFVTIKPDTEVFEILLGGL